MEPPEIGGVSRITGWEGDISGADPLRGWAKPVGRQGMEMHVNYGSPWTGCTLRGCCNRYQEKRHGNNDARRTH
jgi:hypothetical protein